MAREGTFEIQLAGEAVVLDPRRALVWPGRRTVVIADPHIGKADTFRRAGIPVPADIAQADFDRLAQLLTDYDAERLVVLGDFFHARQVAADASARLLAAWRERFATLEVVIVRGNHDWHAGEPPGALGLASVDEPHADGPFVYRHFPLDAPAAVDASVGSDPAAAPAAGAGYTLAGHLHPGVTVSLGGQSVKRVPCFHITPRQAVLPAFGRFTGTSRVGRVAGGRVFAVGRKRVIALPDAAMV